MTDFKLDHVGLGQVLMLPGLRAHVHSVADGLNTAVTATIAAVYDPDPDVVTDDYVTKGMQSNRVASSITVRMAKARLWQARDGLLTRVAAAAGLDVTAK